MELPAYRSLNIFIASPGDVEEERQFAEHVIQEVDRVCKETISVRAEAIRWEDVRPRVPHADEGNLEDVFIRELVEKSQVFLLILNERYGDASGRQSISNTHREIEAALRRHKDRRGYEFMAYFRHLEPNIDPGKQRKKVEELERDLKKRQVLYDTYTSPAEFKEKFTHSLYKVLMKFRLSPTRTRALKCFWELGLAEGQTHPRVAVLYPAANRSFMKNTAPADLWLERLVPHIVFEDFKAVQKIDRTLRMIGQDEIKTYNSISFPPEIHTRNRVWLCVPRNKPGLQQLEKYKAAARFKFEPRLDRAESRIQWRPEHTKAFFEVRSPLAVYLREQRKKIRSREWTAEHGRIFAKDFAILARFSDGDGVPPATETRLKDYFIGGIRGLGTWGAAWFIEHKWTSFFELSPKMDKPVQFLLEVVYHNEAIEDVRDVSRQPQSYFKNELKLSTIKSYIRQNASK